MVTVSNLSLSLLFSDISALLHLDVGCLRRLLALPLLACFRRTSSDELSRLQTKISRRVYGGNHSNTILDWNYRKFVTQLQTRTVKLENVCVHSFHN